MMGLVYAIVGVILFIVILSGISLVVEIWERAQDEPTEEGVGQ